ncbi:cobinamide kinase / cobinamide phosphate guanyltransferase family protein [Mycobacterium xenopi 4042]|uniref:Cobinamide kinase / cobinamide phosphate guanyltransferase family protein n=1 Tax=Mycobacterium xenopi 4042 TaxID=1299334 RepID=X8DDB9_MYCXE|nr:cobinamide kinase / cobinamide phosphate guanyltransferase family protein [Mycobacterium xenopi 4042]
MLGGIRSGKSRWAEAAIAESVPPDQPVRYLATGGPGRRRGLVAPGSRAPQPSTRALVDRRNR